MWCTSFRTPNWGCYARNHRSPRYCFDWLTSESAWACWGISQWFQFCTNNWIWKSYRQDGCRVCSVDHKRDRVTISKQYLEMFQRNSDEFLHRFITVDETWIFHTWDKGTVKTMDFIEWTSSEEGENRKVGRKSEGHSFLRYSQYNSYRLPYVQANDQWRLLRLIGPSQQHFKKKTSPFSEEESAHQNNA